MGVLKATYDVHLRLTGKLLVDFLLVITKLFPLDVTMKRAYDDIDTDTDTRNHRAFVVVITTTVPHHAAQKTFFRLTDVG